MVRASINTSPNSSLTAYVMVPEVALLDMQVVRGSVALLSGGRDERDHVLDTSVATQRAGDISGFAGGCGGGAGSPCARHHDRLGEVESGAGGATGGRALDVLGADEARRAGAG